jgi:hypothetical protein
MQCARACPPMEFIVECEYENDISTDDEEDDAA